MSLFKRVASITLLSSILFSKGEAYKRVLVLLVDGEGADLICGLQ